MKKKIIYFHIGFPKTGSTYLQNNFKKINGIKYFDPSVNKDIFFILRSICFFSEEKFSKSKKIIDQRMSNLNFTSKNLISLETISLSIASMHNYKTNLFRISNVFKNFDIKFFFLIRNQKDILKSIYAEMYYNIQLLSKNNAEFNNFIINKDQNHVIFENLKYFNFINDIKKIIPKAHVKVFQYESLLIEPEDFKNDLSKFLNLKINFLNNYINKTNKDLDGNLNVKNKSIVKSIIAKFDVYLFSGNFYKLVILNKNFFRVFIKFRLIDFFKNKLKISTVRIIKNDLKTDVDIVNYYKKDNEYLFDLLNNHKFKKYYF